MKTRLDQALAASGLVASRSQAENLIKLRQVKVNGALAAKPGALVGASDKLEIASSERYVSRAGLKLASVAKSLALDFRTKIVLDVGSSTGGFTDYALQNGAKKVIAVDVGTDQLHTSLRNNPLVELHEQTDIRDVRLRRPQLEAESLELKGKTIINEAPDIVVVDVSFISLREILPSVSQLVTSSSQLVVMVKPQFEARASGLKHKGVIKNEKIRRAILKDFELWTKQNFVIINKADSSVAGEKGNLERFYLLTKSS